MSPLLVAAGALVALGAAVAIGARGTRTAGLGALIALVFTPFVADPLPSPEVVGFRIVAGTLAAYLLVVAARHAGHGSSSPLGLPATVATALAAFMAGLGATAVALPSFGPAAALAPGLACLVAAIAPVVLARDGFRLGTALLVLANGGLLVRVALVGTAPDLEALIAGGMLVAVAASAAVLAGAAATAAAEPASSRGTRGRRRPPA